MKYSHEILFPTKFIVIIFILSFFHSCTIEKRKYLSGYHIERSNHKDISSKRVYLQDKEQLNAKLKPDLLDGISYTDTYKIKMQTIDTTNLIATNLNSNIKSKVYSKESIVADNSLKFRNDKFINELSRKVKNGIAKKANYTSKNISSTKTQKLDDTSSILKAMGFGFLLGGFVIFWIISILIGILIMLLGLLLLIIGAVSKSSSNNDFKNRNSENSGNYIDVVYLKNGSIIRGIIIEQVPNSQLKIQTKDGSIFVYKMDEIEKIIKELDNK